MSENPTPSRSGGYLMDKPAFAIVPFDFLSFDGQDGLDIGDIYYEFNLHADALWPNEPQAMTKALADVWAERRRQVSQEGWSEDHDDHHDTGELARAASCYAWAASLGEDDQEDVKIYPFTGEQGRFIREVWPWDAHWWKHASPRRMLVKAVALLLAEIERIDRAAHSPNGADTQPKALNNGSNEDE